METSSTIPILAYGDFNAYTYDWAVGFNRRVLKILGLWSYPNCLIWFNRASDFQSFSIILCVFILLTMPQVLALIRVWGHLNLVIDNSVMTIPSFIGGFNLLILRYGRRELAKVFDNIQEDWSVDDNDEKSVMVKYWNLSRVITIGGFSGSLFIMLSDVISFVTGDDVRAFTNLTDIPGSPLPYQTTYPFDYSQTPQYQLVIVSQFVSCTFSVVGFTIPDVIFAMIVLHASSQVENLAHNIENMVTKESKIFQDMLRYNVQRHCRLIEFVGRVEDIFSPILLAILTILSVILCLVGIQLISMNSQNLTFDVMLRQSSIYITYMCYFLLFIFMYCWIGENLASRSLHLYDSIYNCNWTILKPKQYIQIQLLLLRSSDPLTITAGGLFPMTLNTFIQVLKTAGSYFSVLRAMTDG